MRKPCFEIPADWCCEMCRITSMTHPTSQGAVEEAMVVDMEVDMIGGEMVGPVDIVVQKPSIESNINITPRFTPSKLRSPRKTRRPLVWLKKIYVID